MRLLDTQQMPAEECRDRGVEIIVERRAINAGSVGANPGSVLYVCRRARRQEREVNCIWDQMKIWT